MVQAVAGVFGSYPWPTPLTSTHPTLPDAVLRASSNERSVLGIEVPTVDAYSSCRRAESLIEPLPPSSSGPRGRPVRKHPHGSRATQNRPDTVPSG
ncbi:hypothetical protein ACFVWF_28075 [Rhodococcus qingshengii]|uniref:hypothetical protein n=1 Tax=Rhodococcus qingshengii TaxID=334542 RepID=UPI0036DCD550